MFSDAQLVFLKIRFLVFFFQLVRFCQRNSKRTWRLWLEINDVYSKVLGFGNGNTARQKAQTCSKEERNVKSSCSKKYIIKNYWLIQDWPRMVISRGVRRMDVGWSGQEAFRGLPGGLSDVQRCIQALIQDWNKFETFQSPGCQNKNRIIAS